MECLLNASAQATVTQCKTPGLCLLNSQPAKLTHIWVQVQVPSRQIARGVAASMQGCIVLWATAMWHRIAGTISLRALSHLVLDSFSVHIGSCKKKTLSNLHMAITYSKSQCRTALQQDAST